MFTPIKNTKVYEQVVEQIKSMIINGALKKGDKLPTERELAEQLQVSRTSIREAIRALEVIGLVEPRQGAGNYIKENFESSLFEPLSMMFLLEKGKPHDIFEIREAMELETAMLAADRISDAELKNLKELLDKIKDCEDEDSNIILDKAFHYTIARASGNVLIINVLNVISHLIDEFIKDARRNILTAKSNKEELNNLHEQIYYALKDRDVGEAYRAMKGHFKLIEDTFGK